MEILCLNSMRIIQTYLSKVMPPHYPTTWYCCENFHELFVQKSSYFICTTYQGKQNGSVLLTNEWRTEQVGANTNSPPYSMYELHNKYCQKSSKLSIVVMEKQFTHFICIIYPEKHNGTIHLTYEVAVSLIPIKFWTKHIQ